MDCDLLGTGTGCDGGGGMDCDLLGTGTGCDGGGGRAGVNLGGMLVGAWVAWVLSWFIFLNKNKKIFQFYFFLPYIITQILITLMT